MWSVADAGFSLTVNFFSKRGVGISLPADIQRAFHGAPSMPHCHSAMSLHAVEEIGAETACEMQDAIGRGELVIMAGDRLSAGSVATLPHAFMGRECRWPKGVFVFAKLMESPVFFATCVRTGWNSYEAHFAQYRGDASNAAGLLDAYVAFLEREVDLHPEQWYHFHEFFGSS